MDFFNARTHFLASLKRRSQTNPDFGRWRTAALCGRLWLFVTLGLAVTACQSPEERCLDTVRAAVYAGDFSKGLAAADRYYAQHAVEKQHPSEEAMALRWEISAYTRLCLLMTGELNQRFLAYYPVQEMGVLFPAPLPFVNRHCYAYARLYYEMGLYGPALPIVLWQAEDIGWRRETVDLLFGIYTHTHQWRVAQTYWQAFARKGRTRRWAAPWRETIETGLATDTLDGTRPRPLTAEWLAGPRADEGFADGYVKAVFRQTIAVAALDTAVAAIGSAAQGTDTTATALDTTAAAIGASGSAALPNPYLTDYYTLLCLLEKDLTQVPTLLGLYLRQGRVIPDYLQEAALIYASDATQAERLEAAGMTREALHLSPAMEQRVAKVFQDFEMLKAGALPFEAMTRRHAATYTYHFLFGQIQ